MTWYFCGMKCFGNACTKPSVIGLIPTDLGSNSKATIHGNAKIFSLIIILW